jgi:HNH endonuclease/NUMOD4 motif
MSQERARNESRIHTIPSPSDDDPEEWRNLPKNLQLSKYQVSSLGRIKNVKSGHILSSKPRKDGYIGCSLYLDDNVIRKNFSVHILVAKTFIPNKNNKETVNHINVKKHDNRVINLEWSTYSEQKYKENNKPRITRGKPIIQRDLQGNFIKRWEKIVDATKELVIRESSISHALSGKQKQSGGFIWEYCNEDKKDLEGEIWKQISEEYNTSFVSNFGRIKMKDNMPHYGTPNESGYCETSLFNKIKKKYKTFLVHRLVCQAFLPNPDNKPIVNHLDENKSNNKLENLVWTTHSENTNHSLDLHGRISTNCLSRIVLQIQNGIVINEYPSIRQAAIKNGIPKATMSDKCYGRMKQKGEFVWIFKTNFIE